MNAGLYVLLVLFIIFNVVHYLNGVTTLVTWYSTICVVGSLNLDIFLREIQGSNIDLFRSQHFKWGVRWTFVDFEPNIVYV